MSTFLKKFSLFILLITLLDFCWNNFMPPDYYIAHLWVILVFYILLTLTSHYLILNASKGNPNKFIRVYMASTALKMFLCIVVVVIYKIVDKPNVLTFAIAFMLHYMAFTTFEVAALMRDLKKDKDSE